MRTVNTLTLLIYNKCNILSSLAEVVFKSMVTSRDSALYLFGFRKILVKLRKKY